MPQQRFKADLSRFLANVKKDHAAITAKIAFDVLRQIVQRCPVDTGRAKSSFYCSEGSPVYAETDQIDKSGNPSLERGAKVFDGRKQFPVYFITNALPYISELNRGSSKQAPSGFIESSIESVIGRLGR